MLVPAIKARKLLSYRLGHLLIFPFIMRVVSSASVAIVLVLLSSVVQGASLVTRSPPVTRSVHDSPKKAAVSHSVS